MRSGTGRHRRPRQAPAILVTAGMTTAGLAMPLLGAGSAQAADASTWDRVAECESEGRWSSNTGNGHYGGLQLSQENWEAYGGLTYAARPDLASRSQQIAVAERVLAGEGLNAWPGCAVDAGLTMDSKEAPDVDPGLPLPSVGGSAPVASGAADAPSQSAAQDDPVDGSAPGTAGKGEQESDPGAAADTGDGTAAAEDGSTAAPGASGKGKHRGERDPREIAEELAEDRLNESQVSRDNGAVDPLESDLGDVLSDLPVDLGEEAAADVTIPDGVTVELDLLPDQKLGISSGRL